MAQGTAEACDAPASREGANRAGDYTAKVHFSMPTRDGNQKRVLPGERVSLSHDDAVRALADGTVVDPEVAKAAAAKAAVKESKNPPPPAQGSLDGGGQK